jgi:hypothetical protein
MASSRESTTSWFAIWALWLSAIAFLTTGAVFFAGAIDQQRAGLTMIHEQDVTCVYRGSGTPTCWPEIVEGEEEGAAIEAEPARERLRI